MLTALPAQLRPLARIPLEGYRLLEAARISQRFGCRVEDGESFEQAADITVVHSERMAKLGRFNVRHFDGHVFSSVLEDGGMLAMGRQFVKMMRGKMAGENVIDRSFKIDNPSEHPLYLQVDGEATPLPNSARVNFGLSEGHIRILSAKLHDRAA